MTIGNAEVESFFRRYAAALAGRNPAAIAAHWGVPALVLGEQGAIPIARIDEVEAFFASSMAQYEGIDAARANIAALTPLSATVVACEVAWDHLDASGKVIGGEAGHYMLRKDGELRIHVYAPKA